GRAEKLGVLEADAAAAVPVANEDELGGLLLAIVASARVQGLDAERALRITLRGLQDEIREAELGDGDPSDAGVIGISGPTPARGSTPLPELVEGKGRCPLQPEWRGHPARASFCRKFHNKRRRRALAGDLPDRPAMFLGKKNGSGLSRICGAGSLRT